MKAEEEAAALALNAYAQEAAGGSSFCWQANAAGSRSPSPPRPPLPVSASAALRSWRLSQASDSSDEDDKQQLEVPPHLRMFPLP